MLAQDMWAGSQAEFGTRAMAFTPLVVVTVDGWRFEFFAEKVFDLYFKRARGGSFGAGRGGSVALFGPCVYLELVFAMLGNLLGRPVSHYGVASGFLKALGLPDLAKRLAPTQVDCSS